MNMSINKPLKHEKIFFFKYLFIMFENFRNYLCLFVRKICRFNTFGLFLSNPKKRKEKKRNQNGPVQLNISIQILNVL